MEGYKMKKYNEKDINFLKNFSDREGGYLKSTVEIDENGVTNYTMVMDTYELTMAQTYYFSGIQDKIATFSVFFRKNIFDGGYSIMNGLDEIIDYINNFKFTDADIAYLKGTGYFNDDFLAYLKTVKFTGNISAVPNGTVIFPNEPVITVEAPIIEAQVIETALLAIFNSATLVTTAMTRFVVATGGEVIPIMELGARRGPGLEGTTLFSKYAFIGGAMGTSNLLAGKRYGAKVLGTMAHSAIMAYDTEYEAFMWYAKANPTNCTLLVDTYDVLKSGVPNAIRIAKEFLIPNGYKLNSIRIDSGDLAYLSKEARKMLNENGLEDVKICLSNGLTVEQIENLILQGACFDLIGIGDNVIAPLARVGGVYKLDAVGDIPKIKLSEDAIKITNPGKKDFYRFYDKETGFALGDVITIKGEKIDENNYTLINPYYDWKKTELKNYEVRKMLVPIFENGKCVYPKLDIFAQKAYAEAEIKTFYPEYKRSVKPAEYYVDLSEDLKTLKKTLIKEYKK
jgi:nicotinate phosphoribosyltransferase